MDVVLAGLIAGFVLGGWRTGFLRSLLGLAFVVVALIAGSYVRTPVGAIAGTFIKDVPADYANLIGYAIAFPVILAGLHVVASVLLGRVATRGLSRGLDGMLGAILGAVEGVLIVSAAVVILDAYFGTLSTIAATVAPGALREVTQALNASEMVKLLRGSTVPMVLSVLGPFLPADVTTLLPGGLPGRLPFPTTAP